MNTGYKNTGKEGEKFDDFINADPYIVPEVYVLLGKEIAIVRHRTYYNQSSQLIAAAFPHAEEEAQRYANIQASHPGREVMNELGNNITYLAFTNKEWNCDRFVIVPLSEKSRLQKLLFMPHVERISTSDTREAEEIYKGLIASNEYGAYDHRNKFVDFGLKPEQVIIDVINHTITINAEEDFNVGANATLSDFLKDLEIMGFRNVNLNLRETGISLGKYKTFGKDLPADFSKPNTWLPEFENPMKIFIDMEDCRHVRNSSEATIFKNY